MCIRDSQADHRQDAPVTASEHRPPGTALPSVASGHSSPFGRRAATCRAPPGHEATHRSTHGRSPPMSRT
eukprot:14759730-Alexandrium_andersonii.AAC.1